MKKNTIKIIIAIIVMATGFSSRVKAQGYGFVEYFPLNSKDVLISAVKNLSTLNTNGISNKNEYGTVRNRVQFYQECIWVNWFQGYLTSKGLFSNPYKDFLSRVQTPNQYRSCPYGNENTCFMTKEEAEAYRQKEIADLKNQYRVSVIE